MVMMAHLIGEMEKDNVGEPTKHQLLHLVWHLHTDAISHIKHFNKTPKVRYMEPKNQGSNDQIWINKNGRKGCAQDELWKLPDASSKATSSMARGFRGPNISEYPPKSPGLRPQ